MSGTLPALIAQADPSKVEYWANFGIAAVILFVLGSAVAVAIREWWNARRPHYIAKWQAETDKEVKAAKLFDRLTESEEVKNRILETLSDNQQHHAQACDATHSLVKDIHAKVVMGGP